jgi:hypothetical protein
VREGGCSWDEVRKGGRAANGKGVVWEASSGVLSVRSEIR